MTLPQETIGKALIQSEDSSMGDFNLQAMLSLQHLWRIGLQMNVQWWTSIVAYLPPTSHHLLAQKVDIASAAWSHLHSYENPDDNMDSYDERDLWEEKYFAGMENRGGSANEKKLPDWEIIEGQTETPGIAPPFFAAEVEELPRGAGVEWAPYMGIGGKSIRVCALYAWPYLKRAKHYSYTLRNILAVSAFTNA
jgi:diphthine-ammonia ligase